MTETVFADVLLSAQCPNTVYSHELFACTVKMYNDSTADVNLNYTASFNRGLANILGSPAGTISVPAFVEKNVEFNAWAKSTGTDVFTYQYGQGEITSLVGRRVVIISTPLKLDLAKFQVNAGQRTTIRTRISGKGEAVEIHIALPAGVYGTKTVVVGDVSGSNDINFVVTTDPYYVGSVQIPFYLVFYDKLG
ncbi:MAG: hypothetical protein GXN93_05205, partial [Candidatus Diapherotrites archaeon]|nr:hypothetical protein [Candidatus Diapherotrites archaeon]